MDVKSSKERILAAALEEFSAKGISGARVDQIAKRAGVNVRMIYYYFENKENLYREVNTHSAQTDRVQLATDRPEELLSGLLDALFANASGNTSFVRLLQWEALQVDASGAELTNREDRETIVRDRVDRIREAQRAGLLPDGLDPRMLYVAVHSLSLAPFAFPSLVSLATGASPEDAGFQREYREFLMALSEALGQRPGASGDPAAAADV